MVKACFRRNGGNSREARRQRRVFAFLTRRGHFAYPLRTGTRVEEGTTTWRANRRPVLNWYCSTSIYEDGTQRSNRKVPADILGGIDGDEPARALIEEQDREISAKSGMPPLTIQRVVRVEDDVKERARDTRRASAR